MNARVPGQAAFERIRCEIVSGAAHWVERETGCRPFRWEPGRKRPDDGDAEGDDWDEADDGIASARRVKSRSG